MSIPCCPANTTHVILHGWVQVAQRAGEIAKELGLINKADQADPTPTNSTAGNWMNLNLFSRNESDSSNSSWYNARQDEREESTQAAAALQRYQQLDLENKEDADLSPLLSLSSNATAATAAIANDTAIGALMYNVTNLDRTRPQSRAERAGSKQGLVLL